MPSPNEKILDALDEVMSDFAALQRSLNNLQSVLGYGKVTELLARRMDLSVMASNINRAVQAVAQ